MKKLLGTVILTWILFMGLSAQNTEIRFGSGGIVGVPPVSNMGDTLQLNFTLDNTGDVTVNDTLEIWMANTDSTGDILIGSIRLVRILTDSVGVGDSLGVEIQIPLDATFFAPGVNITVVWPLIDMPGTYTTESKSIYIHLQNPSSNIFEQEAQRMKTLEFFPNPASNQIHIESKLDWSLDWHVQAISMDGRILELNRIENRIDLYPLSRGSYFIRLFNSKENYFFQLIKR